MEETFERAAHKLLMYDLSSCRATFKGTLVLPLTSVSVLRPTFSSRENISIRGGRVEYNSREGVVRTGRHVIRLSREVQSIHEEAKETGVKGRESCVRSPTGRRRDTTAVVAAWGRSIYFYACPAYCVYLD